MLSTLPESNVASENRPLEKEIPIGNHHFQVRTVSFREGNLGVFFGWLKCQRSKKPPKTGYPWPLQKADNSDLWVLQRDLAVARLDRILPWGCCKGHETSPILEGIKLDETWWLDSYGHFERISPRNTSVVFGLVTIIMTFVLGWGLGIDGVFFGIYNRYISGHFGEILTCSSVLQNLYGKHLGKPGRLPNLCSSQWVNNLLIFFEGNPIEY